MITHALTQNSLKITSFSTVQSKGGSYSKLSQDHDRLEKKHIEAERIEQQHVHGK